MAEIKSEAEDATELKFGPGERYRRFSQHAMNIKIILRPNSTHARLSEQGVMIEEIQSFNWLPIFLLCSVWQAHSPATVKFWGSASFKSDAADAQRRWCHVCANAHGATDQAVPGALQYCQVYTGHRSNAAVSSDLIKLYHAHGQSSFTHGANAKK